MRLAVFINGFMPGTAERLRAMVECLESAGHSVDTGDVVAVLAREGEALPELPTGVKVFRVAVKNAPEAGGRPLPYLRDVLDAGASVLDCDVFAYLNSDLLMDRADAELLKSGAAKAYVLKSHEIEACSFEDFEARRFKIDVSPRPGFDAVAFERGWWQSGGRAHFPAGFILGEWRWDTAYDAIVRTLPQGLSACGTYHRKHVSAWKPGSAGGKHNEAVLKGMGTQIPACKQAYAATPSTAGEPAVTATPTEVVEVIVSGAAEMMGAWCGAWLRSGNRNPVRFFADATWGAEVRAVCGRVGTVEDATAIYAAVVNRMKPGSKAYKIGWMAKAEIMRAARGEWAVWIDHDVEVQGDIGPMVEYAMKNAEWFASPVYASFCKEDLLEHVAQHGIIVYKPGCEKMKKWADYVPTQSDPNDEHHFMRCFGGYESAKAEVLDLYRKEWYESLQTGAMPIRFEEAVPRLEKSAAVLVHWTSRAMKEPMIRHLTGPAAEPAHAAVNSGGVTSSTVDAVYILGTGSVDNNLELRYSLRSMAKHAPWIRKVWVVGSNPEFLSDEVGFIGAGDDFKHTKDANLIHKAVKACKHEGVAEDFLLCSDDQVVTRPVSIGDFEPRWLRTWREDDAEWYDQSVWHRRLRETLRRFGEGAKYWQPHIWTPMNKRNLLDMAERYSWQTEESCTIMSLYFNHVRAAGRKNFDHVYVGANAEMPATTHVAYGEKAFKDGAFRAALQSAFPEKCKYER